MILPDIPITEYHSSAPQWWSKTSLRYLQTYGAPWLGLWLRGEASPHKPGGIEQGLALDCLLTEGAETFARRYPETPKDAPRRPTKAQREAKKPSPATIDAIAFWDEWDAANPDALSLSDDDRVILVEAADAVRSLPCWPDIEDGMMQATVRRYSEGLGFGLQSRPDFLNPSMGIVRDLKKTRSLEHFGKQAIDLGYHLQAALAGWCLAADGIMVDRSTLVAVEWERGARAREYIIPDEALQDGMHTLQALAGEIAWRIRADDWTDIQESPEPLDIPAWMMRRMEARNATT